MGRNYESSKKNSGQTYDGAVNGHQEKLGSTSSLRLLE